MIRQLYQKDRLLYENMNTGVDDDYIVAIFDYLVTGDNRLYGAFINEQLVSIGGYTLFADRYAMLGKLRTDQAYRGQNLSTKLMTYVIGKAFEHPGIEWAGANTQEQNQSARRVLEKLGLTPHAVLHSATTKRVEELASGSSLWNPIYDLTKKKEWVRRTYLQDSTIFPYECYYPFPASEQLFSDEDLRKWSFYENNEGSRFFIAKQDEKKYHYLHVTYPWKDHSEQHGFWETVSNLYHEQKKVTGEHTYVWIDLSKEEVNLLPKNHPFALPSPWMLYGVERS